ncbi:MAG TPA: prepilin peptidase, partial [Syntrophales bacterium]|nr:prepilin peptidase [Syntrophales bacterium]
MMSIAGAWVVGIVGAIIGSFLNVCIWRIPREESIVFPSSHCPDCSHPIRFGDNVPVISWLILKGRCRDCGASISLRYPLVEALTAALSILLYWKYGFSLQLLCAFFFTAALIVITFIDIDYQIIPDVISLPGIPLCFLAAVFVMGVPFLESLIGILVGGGILYVIAVGYEWIAKREGMGGGDIKLLAMLGAFFGWKSLLFIVLCSSLTG